MTSNSVRTGGYQRSQDRHQADVAAMQTTTNSNTKIDAASASRISITCQSSLGPVHTTAPASTGTQVARALSYVNP